MAKGLWKIIALSLAGVLVIGVVVVVFAVAAAFASHRGLVEQDAAMLAIIGLMAVLIMALAMWLGVAWMQRIDEAAREAHKTAWFYGGSGGMAVGGVFVILAGSPPAQRLALPTYSGSAAPADYAAAGAMAMLVFMLVGYGLVWGWWWLKRR